MKSRRRRDRKGQRFLLSGLDPARNAFLFVVVFFTSRGSQCPLNGCQGGETGDAEIEVPSAGNPELSEDLSLKPGVG